jgi:alginate O-acetyltransferase complex protein AlgI
LGRFLRDYLYIPLGGSRNGNARTLAALSITMLLGGLWHGAGWTFVVWGALHGIFLAIHYFWRQQPVRLPRWLAWLITFISITLAWVVFRANSLHDAWTLLGTMAGNNGIVLPDTLKLLIPGDWFASLPAVQWGGVRFVNGLELLLLLPLIYFVSSQDNVHEMWRTRVRPSAKWWFATTSLAGVAVTQLSANSSFLYFQF